MAPGAPIENTDPSGHTAYRPPPRHMNSAPPGTPTSTNTPFTYKYQGCLKIDEHAMLAANNGCFACHDINISKAEQGYGKCKGCPPPAESYKHRTLG